MAVNPIIQEAEGVLHFNNVTRDEMLKRNLGKYSQWKETLHPAIGEYYDMLINKVSNRFLLQINAYGRTKIVSDKYFGE